MMRSLLVILCLILLPTPSIFAGDIRYDETPRMIDFAVGYPLVHLKSGVERRQWGTAGFTFTYHWFFLDRLGWSFGPHAWFVPVRIASKKAMIFAFGFESGPNLRLFPDNYFDPTLAVLGGADLTDAGRSTEAQFAYPVGGRFGINLFRETSRYQDSSLALNFSTTARYYFNSIPDTHKPFMLDFNLAFRGSF